MGKIAAEAGVDMITDLENQITMEGFIPAEWKLSNTVNCYKGKGNSAKRGNSRGLKLTD